MNARLLSLALAGLLVPGLAVGAAAEDPGPIDPPPSDGGNADVLSDAEVLGILQVANAGEIATGEQAQRKAESAAVREFGARMVAEHSALDEQLATLAAQLGLAPTPSKVSAWLEGTADHILTATEPYSGASYDVLYTDGQLFLHSTVVGLADWLSTEAESPELRSAILAARPIILDHLDAATALRQELGDPPETFVK